MLDNYDHEKMISVFYMAIQRRRFCYAFQIKIIVKRVTFSANSGIRYLCLSVTSIKIVWHYLYICEQFRLKLIIESLFRTSSSQFFSYLTVKGKQEANFVVSGVYCANVMCIA